MEFKNIYFLVCLVLLLSACKQTNAPIDQSKMVDLLVDLHMSDGTLNAAAFPFDSVALRPENIYQNVLAKHQVDRVLFDSALAYYTKDRETYLKIYEEVIEKLSTKQGFVEASVDQQGVQLKPDDMYQFKFSTDFEDTKVLDEKMIAGLNTTRAFSGKTSFSTSEGFSLGFSKVQALPLQEVQFEAKGYVLFENLPEKFPSIAFILESKGKMESVVYNDFSKLQIKPKTWVSFTFNTTLKLSKPERHIKIQTYIFNSSKVKFFIDNYEVSIKQIK